MRKTSNNPQLFPCPCGSDELYQSCCKPLHTGLPANDAETLMRSRYSAYVLQLEDYLLNTWYVDTRPSQIVLESTPVQWLGLSVIRHQILNESEAIVEFIAKYKIGGNRAEKMHEVSHFIFQDAWYYVSGEVS